MKIVEWIATDGALLATFGTAVAFVWTVFQFLVVRREENHWKQYETYHQLIADLVGPKNGQQQIKLDCQRAAVFELRHYLRYKNFTIRTLEGVKEGWEHNPANARLIVEIDLTLLHLKQAKRFSFPWSPNQQS